MNSPVKRKNNTWRNVNPFTCQSEGKGISDAILRRTKMKRKKNTKWEALQHHIFRSKLKFETDVTEERIDSNRKFYREKCWQRQTGVVRSMKGILLKFETKLGSKLDYSQRWLAQYHSPSSTDNWSGVYIITPLNTFEWCKNKFFLCLTKQYKTFWEGNVTVNQN